MSAPLVTVICLCYNHERYVAESLLSVLNQTYPNIQLIIVDDQSQDRSVETINQIIEGMEDVTFIKLTENKGNCGAFNEGLKHAKGDYIIDLAADDVLIKTRVERGVESFATHSSQFGVNYTDAVYIDEYSSIIGYHFERDQYGSLMNLVPEGDIYSILLEKYIICTPSMMIKKQVLDELGGYDENLTYEDFDFWVRSSRKFRYCYTDEVLVRKRSLQNSMVKRQYKEAKFLESTYKVCQKAFEMNRNELENKALCQRIRYEMRQCMIYGHYQVADSFYELYKQLNPGIISKMFFKTGLILKPKLGFLARFQGEIH